MKVLCIANHKGGTGKTATTRALGDVLSDMGRRVLMVDNDPQASLTTSCGIADADPSLADVLGGSSPGKLHLPQVIRNIRPGLDLVPSALPLAVVELGLHERRLRELVLSKALEVVSGEYDICLIDCAPSLGLLTVGAMAAAHSCLIPSQPMPVDVAGVRLFLQTVDAIREDVNPALTILGIVLTFFDARLNAHQSALQAMKAAGWPVLPVTIGRSVRVGEAAAVGESILTFEEGNPQAAAYQELGRLVDLWLKAKSARR